MMPAETHAELAAGQCDAVGRNKGSERVLLVQFYRLLAKTTKKLVKLDSKPRTLEEAVDKAADIDDPMDEERDTERDEGRAAGCVSTVRSAMTAVRFLGKGREKELVDERRQVANEQRQMRKRDAENAMTALEELQRRRLSHPTAENEEN
ncbi:hypothetical protein PC123_g11546 [Phytophthora cactorum]|nr:hypothetical protein PC123_g11546 [Phytophthora cactorum]